MKNEKKRKSATSKKSAKKKKKKSKQRLLIDVMELDGLGEVKSYKDRFLTHDKVMSGAHKAVQERCDVSEHGTYSLLMPGDKRMLFVPQDDPNGGKSKEWMKRRKDLFWTASKPAGSFFDVTFFHPEVAEFLKSHRRYVNATSYAGNQSNLVSAEDYEKLEDHKVLWKCLVSFKEVDDHHTDFSLFKMRNGTECEDVAIEEFVKQYKNVFAAEEYLHIFNESTSQGGWSAGTSPDGLLLWYERGKLVDKTSLEVKCGSTCTNTTCKERRKRMAMESGKTIEDEGFYCKDKSHFKVHNCIKTYYVGQMCLEMLGQNLSHNTYVSLGYGKGGVPKVKAFRMKFHRGALLATALYMRTQSELKELAQEIKDDHVFNLGVNSPDFTTMNEDIMHRTFFLEGLLSSDEYAPLLARLHQNFETMKRFSEHAVMGAHGWTTYSKRWRELEPPVREKLRNARPLDPSDFRGKGRLPSLEDVHADLAECWVDPAVKFAPVDFESPDTSFLTPMSPAEFKRAYDKFLTEAGVDLEMKDFLMFKVPQGVLSDEFRFCLDYPNPLYMEGKLDKAQWSVGPTKDDARIELRFSEEKQAYTAHLVRSAARARDLNRLDYEDESSGVDSEDLLYEDDDVETESYAEDSDVEMDGNAKKLSREDVEALEMLRRLEGDDGVPAEEWLVSLSPDTRAEMLCRITNLMGWERVLLLPDNLDEFDGQKLIARPLVGSDNEGFDSLFIPPASYRSRPAWKFTRYVFHKATNWSPCCMAAPPRVGGYDDEGNVYMNEFGGLDGKVPASIDKIERGCRVKVVVSNVWDRVANFHTILVHKSNWLS